MREDEGKNLKVVNFKGVNNNYQPFAGVIVSKKKKLNPKDILRIHSQLISGFISGKVQSDDAKSLSFLCVKYLECLNIVEFETKLNTLESQVEKLTT